jgi:ABC-type branched-subunit amino acid transport system ATPase component
MTSDIDAHSAGADLRAGDDILSVRGLRKTFPGVVALDAVDFGVRAGRVRTLLGQWRRQKHVDQLVAVFIRPTQADTLDRPSSRCS